MMRQEARTLRRCTAAPPQPTDQDITATASSPESEAERHGSASANEPASPSYRHAAVAALTARATNLATFFEQSRASTPRQASTFMSTSDSDSTTSHQARPGGNAPSARMISESAHCQKLAPHQSKFVQDAHHRPAPGRSDQKDIVKLQGQG